MNNKKSGFINIFLLIIVFILLLVTLGLVVLLVILNQQNSNTETASKDIKNVEQIQVSPTSLTNSTKEEMNVSVSKPKFAEILQKVAFNMSSLDSVNVDFTRKNVSSLSLIHI